MLNNIDFNRLKVFYYIFHNESLALAAKSLNISPSAVSQQLKKLEEELSVSLFTRIHKKLIPTSEAIILHSTIEPFIGTLEENIRSFEMGRDEPSGTIRLGSPSEFGKFYLPKMIATFQESCPKVKFELSLSNSHEILEELKKGQLDFAIVDVHNNKQQTIDELIFNTEEIVDERFLLACSTEYYDTNIGKNFSYEQLVQQRFIAYDANHRNLRTWFHHHYGKQVNKINVALTVDNVQAVVTALENNIGLGVVTCHSVDKAVNAGFIKIIQTGKKDIINRISIAQLQDKTPSLTEKKFIQHIRAYWRNSRISSF